METLDIFNKQATESTRIQDMFLYHPKLKNKDSAKILANKLYYLQTQESTKVNHVDYEFYGKDDRSGKKYSVKALAVPRKYFLNDDSKGALTAGTLKRTAIPALRKAGILSDWPELQSATMDTDNLKNARVYVWACSKPVVIQEKVPAMEQGMTLNGEKIEFNPLQCLLESDPTSDAQNTSNALLPPLDGELDTVQNNTGVLTIDKAQGIARDVILNATTSGLFMRHFDFLWDKRKPNLQELVFKYATHIFEAMLDTDNSVGLDRDGPEFSNEDMVMLVLTAAARQAAVNAHRAKRGVHPNAVSRMTINYSRANAYNNLMFEVFIQAVCHTCMYDESAMCAQMTPPKQQTLNGVIRRLGRPATYQEVLDKANNLAEIMAEPLVELTIKGVLLEDCPEEICSERILSKIDWNKHVQIGLVPLTK